MSEYSDELVILAISAAAWGCLQVDGYHESFLRNFTDEEIQRLSDYEESLQVTYGNNLDFITTVLKSKLKELEN